MSRKIKLTAICSGLGIHFNSNCFEVSDKCVVNLKSGTGNDAVGIKNHC